MKRPGPSIPARSLRLRTRGRWRLARAASVVAFGALLVAALVWGCSSDCNNVAADIGAACLPGVIAANLESLIQVRESCGTNCAQPPSCTAVLLSGAVVLELREDQCPMLSPGCAQMLCMERVVNCKIPPLTEGDYPVVIPGSASRVLHVRDTGTERSCTLPAGADAGM